MLILIALIASFFIALGLLKKETISFLPEFKEENRPLTMVFGLTMIIFMIITGLYMAPQNPQTIITMGVVAIDLFSSIATFAFEVASSFGTKLLEGNTREMVSGWLLVVISIGFIVAIIRNNY